jgi:signal transduction histidine kinase/ligand-binding sensor domain-containing protein
LTVRTRLLIALQISALSFFPGLRTAAQPPAWSFRHITAYEGLASNTVRGIIQDERGFMWISTFNGLQRYDGYEYATYHHDPLDSNSLSTDGSTCLLRDLDGNIWLSSWPWGFTIFDPVTGKSRRVYDPSLSDAQGACMDKTGNIWMIASASLGEYERRSHQLILFKHSLPEDVSFTRVMIYDSAGNGLYLNSVNYGICFFDLSDKQLYYRLHNPRHIPLLNMPISSGPVLIDRRHGLWMFTPAHQMFRCDLDSNKITEFIIPAQRSKGRLSFDCALQDSKGAIWFGSGEGELFRYSPKVGYIEYIPPNVQDPYGFHSDGVVNCLYEDGEGNIWTGTARGIDIFNPKRQKFHSVSIVDPHTPAVDPTHSLLNFLERPNGDIWIATFGDGIFVVDKSLQFKVHYTADKGNPHNPRHLPHDDVWSLLQKPDGRIIIGSQHGWISLYDPATGIFDNQQPPELHKLTVANLAFDKNKNVWMALYLGLGKWDRKKDSFTYYPQFIPFQGVVPTVPIDLTIDDHNGIWVATIAHGLQRFDLAAERFVEIDTPQNHCPNSISSVALQSIIRMNDTLLAMGTSDAGIDILNQSTGKFTYITTRDGLPSNNVSALFYHSHQLWAATEQGLCRIDLLSKQITAYGPEDGISGNDFTDMLRFYKLKDGHLLAGYKGGLVYFDPDSTGLREPPKDVTITNIRVFEQSLSPDSILHGSDTARFSYRQNFIGIHYASLSYAASDQMRYYYQLEGVDKNWVDAGSRRFADYTDLPGGRYLFKVRCENRDRISCAHLTSFYIIIDPPFWRTGWFYLLIAALLLGLLYAAYRYRIRQILQLQAVRNKISKDIHDDVGATLSSISILSEVAKNKIEQGEEGQSYSLLTKISSHSREMVEKMSDIIWSIKTSNDTIENIIQRLKNFALTTCSARDIALQFHADEKILHMTLPMEVTKNTYLIGKEAVNNAIKHANCRKITVGFTAHPWTLEITITDDGAGFDIQSKKTGNGLLNIEQRTKEIAGSLVIQSGKGQTRIVVRIPIP